jgi:hypothetical protein
MFGLHVPLVAQQTNIYIFHRTLRPGDFASPRVLEASLVVVAHIFQLASAVY